VIQVLVYNEGNLVGWNSVILPRSSLCRITCVQ